MTEKPDYWCVVALDYDKEQAWIVAMSDACRDRDVLAGGTEISDNGVSTRWIENAAPGLYRLALKPWAAKSIDGDYDCGVDVTEARLLVAFPPL